MALNTLKVVGHMPDMNYRGAHPLWLYMMSRQWVSRPYSLSLMGCCIFYWWNIKYPYFPRVRIIHQRGGEQSTDMFVQKAIHISVDGTISIHMRCSWGCHVSPSVTGGGLTLSAMINVLTQLHCAFYAELLHSNISDHYWSVIYHYLTQSCLLPPNMFVATLGDSIPLQLYRFN